MPRDGTNFGSQEGSYLGKFKASSPKEVFSTIEGVREEPYETLAQSWARMKDMVKRCPQASGDRANQVFLFYEG